MLDLELTLGDAMDHSRWKAKTNTGATVISVVITDSSSIVVRTLVSAGELSLSCAKLLAG